MKNQKTFQDLCLQWLAYKAISIKVSTYAEYRRIIYKKILPMLGSQMNKEIRLEIILQFITSLQREGLSSKSVTDIIVVLKGILRFGRQLGCIDLPPELIPLPKKCVTKVKTITDNDIIKIINYLKISEQCIDMGILISIYTGARVGEVCALKWKHVDFHGNYIQIAKTVQRVKIEEKTEVMLTAPKSISSIRKLPMPKELYEILSKNQKQESDYIISGSSRPIEPRIMQLHFKRVLKKTGIADINYHALRHTFATKCIQCGVDIKSLSEILGHSCVNITLNTYVHSSFEIKNKQIQKLDYTCK